MPMDQDKLHALDARGYVVVEALTHVKEPPGATHATPHAFLCIDGKTYWVKAKAQQGLVAELIMARLGHTVDAAPNGRVIRVTPEALPVGDKADHLKGVLVGLEDKPGSVNVRELAPYLANGEFAMDQIDHRSVGRVTAFQTWTGVGDTQVLIELKTGRVWSIDHGEALGQTGTKEPPSLVNPPIPGVTLDVDTHGEALLEGVGRIEQVTDAQLLEAVAGVPVGDPWRSPVERRFEVATWLADRREALREVIEQWLNQ